MSQPVTGADVNRSAVLAAIGALGSMSRADLARVLRVSPALVTQLTKALLADGLIRELEPAPSQAGRPTRMLALSIDAGHAIGVKVATDHVTMVEVAIDGVVARSATEPFDASSPAALASLGGLLQRFAAEASSSKLIGVGIGVPGSVDDQAEGTVDSSQLAWGQVPVGRTLRRELGLPVIVENNVNALTMAARLHGLGRNEPNLLVVTIGSGVGAGIVVDGSVVRGASGGAGEIGHIPVAPDGPLCQCGNRGCLEALIGEAGLIDRARAAGVLPETGTVAMLRDLADDGDLGAQELFAEAGHLLGRTLAGVVNTLDPSMVILLGEGVTAWKHWDLGFELAFRSAVMPRMRGVAVAVERWQDDSWAQGAAALVLATPFDAEGIAGEQGRLVRQLMFAPTTEASPA